MTTSPTAQVPTQTARMWTLGARPEVVRSVLTAALVLIIGVVGGGCVPGGDETAADPAAPTTSPEPMAVAESMISGQLAEQVGLGPLSPSCADPGPLTVGVTFSCEATTDGGAIVTVAGTVEADGRIALATTNLVTAAALGGFEQRAVDMLNREVGSTFAADAIDCGDGPVVLPPEPVLRCALTVTSTGQVYDVTLSVTDLDQRNFALAVADQPRPG